MNPTRIEHTKFLALKGFANKLSGLYFAQVYLIGSSIDNEKYNDVDLMVVIDDDIFELKFGNIEDWKKEYISGNYSENLMWKIVHENKKRWVNAHNYIKLNIDMKIFPKKYFSSEYAMNKKIRLDEGIF
jgi:hypothetical protein